MKTTSVFPKVALEEFDYHLPENRIAQAPLTQRDGSKLLYYHKGVIKHHSFTSLPDLLPSNCSLYFNDTKVIPARVYFRKPTGSTIEIFLLNPVASTQEIGQVMASVRTCRWKCLIGNKKRWKVNEILRKKLEIEGKELKVSASLDHSTGDEVTFTWDGDIPFAIILDILGHTPLPPYIKREDNIEDKERYQTIFAKAEGAVAAPTAGLHFTPGILSSIKEKGFPFGFLTLHVGAGTFQPITTNSVERHPMHKETMVLTKANLDLIRKGRINIAVGTTSMRCLESLYWYGTKMMKTGKTEFFIKKNDPYKLEDKYSLPTLVESLDCVGNYLRKNRIYSIYGSTQLFIVPGYKFRVVHGLLTNFHMPRSTLLLLIAAFMGKNWKSIYEDALSRDYRFLSYGDSSLIIV